MPMVRPEWVKAIKQKINIAYEVGEIQTFEDFKKVFLDEWDSLGVDDNHLRGAALQSVLAGSSVVVALRQKKAEANLPIKKDSSIKALPISLRIYDSLIRAGLGRVGSIIDILQFEGIDGLLNIRNIGTKAVQEICDALKWAGIEVPEPSESSGQDSEESEKKEIREKPAETERSQRRIILKAGEIFKTEFFPKNTKEIIIVFSDLESLGIKARRIVIEAEG